MIIFDLFFSSKKLGNLWNGERVKWTSDSLYGKQNGVVIFMFFIFYYMEYNFPIQ
jgi:hypothetical protein